MKRAYRIMAATLTLAIALGNIDLSVLATEATYSVNETEEVSTEQVESDNPIMEVIEEQADESGLEQVSETEEIETENTETVEENNEDLSETTETSPTVGEQDEEAETQEEVVVESTESEESVENDEIMEEKTETVLTVGEQVTEAETLEDEVIEETEETVSGNSIEIEEETETSPTVGEQDEEAETLEKDIIKFMVTFVDSEGNEVYSVEVSEVDEIELPEAPELDGYEFIKWDIDLSTLELTEDLVIEPIYEEIQEEVEEEKEPELAYCELSKTVDNKVVSIKGIMPENAEIVVEKVKYTANIKKDIEESLNDKATVVVYEAFDIKIKVDGTEYQPNEFDESVVVSIKNINVKNKENEELKVFHIDNSNNIEEVESTVDTSSKVAEFVAESFSVYVIGGVTYNTDDATLLENNYGTAYLYADGTLLVTEFKSDSSDVANYPWYNYKDSITSLKFIDTITVISGNAFRDYTNITGELVLPSSLTSIKMAAFNGCTGFTGDLVIPNNVTSIGDGAFTQCTGFTGKLILGNSLKTIAGGAFYGCSGFTGDLVIPDSVTGIYERVDLSDPMGAFQGCSGFNGTLTLGSNLQVLQGLAFAGCSGFTGDLVIPDSLTEIGYYYTSYLSYGEVFRDCSGFTSLTIGNNVETIHASSFAGCTGMRGNLVIPNSTITIMNDAFNNCGFDGNLILSNSLQSIKVAAFKDCSNLVGNLTLPNTLVEMENYAFANCTSLNGTLTLSEGLTSIAGGAFYNCYNLKGNLVIPDSVTTIASVSSWGTKEGAFENCYGFDGTLDLGDGVEWIQNKAFKNCYGFTGTLNIPANCKTVGNSNNYDSGSADTGAFSGCSGFTALKLNEGTVTLHKNSFLNCSGFSNQLVLPSTLTSIKVSAFSGCSSLTGDLKIPESITVIEDAVFYNCSGLDGELVFPTTLTSIGANAFYNCSGLTGDLVLQDTIRFVGANAFYNCHSLGPNLIIGAGFNNSSNFIDSKAFYDCYGIDNVDISDNCTAIYKRSNGSQFKISSVANGVDTTVSERAAALNVDFLTLNDLYSGYRKAVTVQFNTDGGNPIADIKIFNTQSITLPTAEKVDHRFNNWKVPTSYGYDVDFNTNRTYTADNLRQYSTDMVTVLNADYTEIIKYTVTFNSNGGSGVADQIVIENEKVTKPADPTKEGYNFISWCTAAGLRQTYNFNNPVTSDMTLYAKWEIKKYNVYFKNNEGETIRTKVVNHNDLATSIGNLDVTGYNFTGWCTDVDGTNFYNFDTPVTGDITLYPGLEIKKYTVKFDTKGGNSISDKVVEHFETFTVSDPTKEGHIFQGWYTDEEYMNERFLPTSVISDITLYAKWEKEVYEIRLDSNGGTSLPVQEVEYNDKLNRPINITKRGYEFKGWFTDQALTSEYDFNTLITSPFTLYAKWERITYSVQFNSNGGSAVVNQVIGEGDKVVKPTDPTLTHYEFKGWFKDQDLTDEWDFNTDTVTAATTLYAKWEELPFVYVTYILDNGEPDVTSKYYAGETTVPPATPLKEKAVFEGWQYGTYVDVNYDTFVGWQEYIANYMTLHSGELLINDGHVNRGTHLAFKARYTNEVIEDVNDGVTPEKVTQQSNTVQYTLNTPYRDGYKFRWWNVYKNNAEQTYMESQGFTRDVMYPIIYQPVIFRAEWIKIHTINFDSDGGTAVSSQNVEDGSVILKPADPTKEKHMFDGWYNGTEKWDFAIDVPNSDIELKAKWIYTPDKYQFTFNSNGGNSIPSQEITEGGTATRPTDPTRKGYTFKGWYTDTTFTTEYDFSEVVAVATTIVAKWEINEYTISFDTQGGNVVPSQTLEFNSLVNKPSNPTKEGYTFRGWYKDPVGLVAWDFTSDVVEEDRIIIAVWDANKFTVSFDSDGGSAVAAQVVEYNKQVTKPSNPTKSGYKFIGWFNGTDEFDFSTPVKEEITLKAKWEEVKVTPQPEQPEDTEPTPDTDPDETPETEPEVEPTEEPEVEPEVIEIIPEIVPEDIEPEIEIPVIEIEEDEIPEIEIPEIEDETPAEEIIADEEEAITVDNPLYSVKVEDNNMKNAMAKFVEAMKYMTIVLSISILAVLGILGLLLLLVAWMKKVKVHNDHNLDDYADEDFVVVYKTSVKSEGNRLAELFKKEDRVWTLSIPEEVVADRVTNSFKIELNKSFCKRYNGEQLIVVMENSNEELVKNLGFVIDEKENEIKFILA